MLAAKLSSWHLFRHSLVQPAGDWTVQLALTFIALAVPAIRDRPALYCALSAGITALLAWNLPYKLGLICSRVGRNHCRLLE